MADVGVVESRNRTGFAGKTLGELVLDTLIATSRFSRESWARYTSPMPPAPMCAAISYGPSLSPAESGMCLPELSLADQKVDRERITAQPEIIFPKKQVTSGRPSVRYPANLLDSEVLVNGRPRRCATLVQ
jgi:hypothetical protein